MCASTDYKLNIYVQYYLLHASILAFPTKLQIPKPELDISLKPVRRETINLKNPRDAGEIGDRFLHLLVAFLLHLSSHGLLAEKTQRIDLLLVVDVRFEVALEKARTLEPVLELAPLLYNLGDLEAREETSPLEVVELCDHSFEPILYHVRHCWLL